MKLQIERTYANAMIETFPDKQNIQRCGIFHGLEHATDV